VRVPFPLTRVSAPAFGCAEVPSTLTEPLS